MQKRQPAMTAQADILSDPLDGYPDRQPYYTLGFLLLKRPHAAPEKEAMPESDSTYLYFPDELKRLQG